MRIQILETFTAKTLSAMALAFFFFVFLVIIIPAILPVASSVRMTVQLDHRDNIQVYYANNIRKAPFEEKYSVISKTLAEGKKHTIKFKLENYPIYRLRIDPGHHDGTVKLYQIIIHSHFANPVIMGPQDIYRLFRPSTENVKVRLQKKYIEINSSQEDPQLVSIKPVLPNHLILAWGLPLIGAVFCFLILQRFDVSRFPPIYDLKVKKPTIGDNINALDGIRSLAMLMVIADHTWGRFSGLGTGGVWIFFCLSGFLLVKPYMDNPGRMLSFKSLSAFFLRRITRIVPVYYAYLTVIYLLDFRFDDTIRHALFLQGNGHLWVIPQLMFFYLVTPIILLTNHLLLKNKPWLIIGTLTLVMILANHFLDKSIISMYGMNHQALRIYIGIFLAGIIFSYVYYQFYLPMTPKLSRFNPTIIFAAMAFILIMFFLLTSTERLWGGKRIFAQMYFEWFGIAAGAMLFSVLAAKKAWINRFLSWTPLRTISLVSYSLYLFHPLVLNCIRKGVNYYYGHYLVGFPLFMATVIGSYFVACLTYTFIERPFFNVKINR